MFVVPFIHNIVKQPQINIHKITFLTIGGEQMWEEEHTLDIDRDILNPNDIYRKGEIIDIYTKTNKCIKLCQVDTDKMNICDFYKWEEIDINDSETFCWKTYIQIMDVNKHSWLNIPDNEKLSNYFVKDIIQTILKQSKDI